MADKVKDAPDKDFSGYPDVNYVPVPAWNQPQPKSANMILQALGGNGSNEPLNLPKDGDNVPPLEGYVPPVNRNGRTGADDPLLSMDKNARLQLADTEGRQSAFVDTIDPRDNEHAPDKPVDSSSK